MATMTTKQPRPVNCTQGRLATAKRLGHPRTNSRGNISIINI
jgi:hypothetical protein